jgi:hypothetical protein
LLAKDAPPQPLLQAATSIRGDCDHASDPRLRIDVLLPHAPWEHAGSVRW